MRRLALTCHHYAFCSVCFWATSYILTKIAMESYSAGAMGLIRNAVGSLVLGAVIVRLRLAVPARRDWLLFLLSGITGLGLYMVLFNQGTRLAGATTSCILIATAPVLTAVLARMVFREMIRPAGWAAIGLAFCGILVMSLWEGTFSVNAGVYWLLGASLSLSVYFLLQRGLSRRYSTLQITAYSFLASVLFLLPFVPETVSVLAAAPASHTVMVLYMGVFPSAVGYICWVKALSIAPKTSTVTNYMFLTPLLSLLLEFAVTGGIPDTGTLLGGAMILGALVLFSAVGKKA